SSRRLPDQRCHILALQLVSKHVLRAPRVPVYQRDDGAMAFRDILAQNLDDFRDRSAAAASPTKIYHQRATFRKISFEFLLEQLRDTRQVNVPEMHVADVLAVSLKYPGACLRGFDRRIVRRRNCQLDELSAVALDPDSNHVVRLCQQDM